MGAIERIAAKALETWRPPKKITLSQWADQYAFLSAESSAKEGRWRTLPYQREIMDSMTDPTVEEVVFMKSARVGFTKCLNNLIGYHIHQDPCSIMLVQPTESDAEGYSKEEIAPMLRDTPVLQGLVADAKSRDSNNTTLNKSFPGGVLSLVGANSPRGFRRVSRRIVLFDEVDGYPPAAGKEGDQIKLGKRRSEYFWNRKIVSGSTPTVKGVSRIERMFEDTDQRRYFVPCPHCGEMQYLKWSNIRWPKGNPLAAYYACEANGCVIDHAQKYSMIERGEWRPTAEAKRPGLRGYHIWAAYSYSPNATWGQLAMEWEESQGNPELMKTFVNTALGEVWEDVGERVDEDALLERVEEYPADTLPEGVLVLTAGIDVQMDRIEMEVVGWGLDEESWSIGYRVMYGDPQGTRVWQELDAALLQTYMHPNGFQLRLAKACIDTGGGEGVTQATYDYVKTRSASMPILGVKGRGGDGLPVIGVPTRNNIAKIPLFPVGTFAAKDTVYGRLKIAEPGPGYCHFGPHNNVAYFKGLTAEEVRIKINKRGFPVREWVKVYDRNEPLDCRVYATAALHSMQLNLLQIAEALKGTWQPDAAGGRKVRGEISPAA